MYKYGVAHCCCGGCEVLHVGNDVNADSFTAHYQALSGSAAPTFTTAGSYSSIHFSGDSQYDIIDPDASYGDDNIGYMIQPLGWVNQMEYEFRFGTNTPPEKTITMAFSMDEQQNKTNTVPWDRLTISDGTQIVYDSSVICTTSHRFSGKIFLIRKPQDPDISGDINRLDIYAEDENGTDDYFLCRIAYSPLPSFQTRWKIFGTDYSLDMSNGYTHLWKPDKWWLFDPNNDSATDSVVDDGEEYQRCEYPKDKCYILGNIPVQYPNLKLWITGMQNGSCCNTSGESAPFALSKLNGYEVRGYWRDNCTIVFNNTRWVVGDTLNNTVSPTTAQCPHELEALPVMLADIELTATENPADSDLIDLSVEIYANLSINYSTYNHGANSCQRWTLTGCAYKDIFGQLDINRLDEVELKPSIYQDGINTTDPFYSAIAYLSISNHQETHHPVSHAFISDSREIDSFVVTWQVGLLGFNSAEPNPTEIADFRPLYSPATFLLSPVNTGGGSQGCPHAPTSWESPDVTSSGEYSGISAQIDAISGFVYLRYDANIYGSGINALTEILGARATSPRHNNTPALSDSDDWGATYLPIDDATIPINTGNAWDELCTLAPTSYPGYFYKPGYDVYWANRLCCRRHFRGDETLVAIENMDGAHYAVTLDQNGSPLTDPATWETYKWYGAMPAAIGSISVIYRDE